MSRAEKGLTIFLKENLPCQSKEGNRGQVLEIAVDRTPVELPEYAQGLSLYKFWQHLQNTYEAVRQISECGEWIISVGVGPGNLDQRIMTSLAQDRDFGKYLVALLRHGPDNSFDEGSYCECASILADWLDIKGVSLEITPDGEFRHWGMFLKQGTIIVRGNAKSISGVGEAGLVYVDGNVDLVDSPAGGGAGIVYVTGKIAKLYDPDYLTVIAAGGIGDYKRQKYWVSGREKSIPPFIFTSSQASSITGWRPEETRQKAMLLCQKKLETEFKRQLSSSKSSKGLAKIAEILFQDNKNTPKFYNDPDVPDFD